MNSEKKFFKLLKVASSKSYKSFLFLANSEYNNNNYYKDIHFVFPDGSKTNFFLKEFFQKDSVSNKVVITNFAFMQTSPYFNKRLPVKVFKPMSEYSNLVMLAFLEELFLNMPDKTKFIADEILCLQYFLENFYIKNENDIYNYTPAIYDLNIKYILYWAYDVFLHLYHNSKRNSMSNNSIIYYRDVVKSETMSFLFSYLNELEPEIGRTLSLQLGVDFSTLIAIFDGTASSGNSSCFFFSCWKNEFIHLNKDLFKN
ncbi:MAG: hypothetical protein ACXW1A_00805 [Nitrososphaeraceae archaeon]